MNKPLIENLLIDTLKDMFSSYKIEDYNTTYGSLCLRVHNEKSLNSLLMEIIDSNYMTEEPLFVAISFDKNSNKTNRIINTKITEESINDILSKIAIYKDKSLI